MILLSLEVANQTDVWMCVCLCVCVCACVCECWLWNI